MLIMEKHQLSFCTVNILTDKNAELIINDNIEVNIDMLEDLDEFLCSIFHRDFGILVNKSKTCSYTLEARLIMSSIEPIRSKVNYVFN